MEGSHRCTCGETQTATSTVVEAFQFNLGGSNAMQQANKFSAAFSCNPVFHYITFNQQIVIKRLYLTVLSLQCHVTRESSIWSPTRSSKRRSLMKMMKTEAGQTHIIIPVRQSWEHRVISSMDNYGEVVIFNFRVMCRVKVVRCTHTTMMVSGSTVQLIQ